MTQISEQEKRRAENIIWNCARDYGFTPDYKAYDRNGRADYYWNCILGAVRYHYDYAVLEPLFFSVEGEEDAEVYEGLLWLGLENAVFSRECALRPVLEGLRKQTAEAFIAQYGKTGAVDPRDDYHLLDALTLAHWQRALGTEPVMSSYDIALLDELEFDPDMSAGEIAERAAALLEKWFQIRRKERREHRRPFRRGFGRQGGREGKGRRSGFGFLVRRERKTGGSRTGGAPADERVSKMSASELRAFMESKFGASVCTLREQAEMERTLCAGSHTNCHLLLTAGEKRERSGVQSAFEALARQQEEEQIARNRRYYQSHIEQNRTAVNRLTAKIQNSILLHLQKTETKATAGKLAGGTVWRAEKLGDEKVFLRSENDSQGDLSVDILLDASTSQRHRQERISTQAFIIAEALTRCGVPCRVLSFCSMTGYTVLRIFREYGAPRDNAKIFEYVSNGCNRDGLAIRAARHLIQKESFEHRILIVLSDVKPNDVVRVRSDRYTEPVPYESLVGLTDTAMEVRAARAEGIQVLCVFTGEDEDLPSARTVYGQDFARILSIDRLADTVGALIQDRIRNF